MKIKGLDALIRKMKELEKANSELDGDIAKVSFNPHDPQSIELAIAEIEATIDERMGGYRGNDMIEKVAHGLKEQARVTVLERAAIARLRGGDE